MSGACDDGQGRQTGLCVLADRGRAGSDGLGDGQAGGDNRCGRARACGDGGRGGCGLESSLGLVWRRTGPRLPRVSSGARMWLTRRRGSDNVSTVAQAQALPTLAPGAVYGFPTTSFTPRPSKHPPPFCLLLLLSIDPLPLPVHTSPLLRAAHLALVRLIHCGACPALSAPSPRRLRTVAWSALRCSPSTCSPIAPS